MTQRNLLMMSSFAATSATALLSWMPTSSRRCTLRPAGYRVRVAGDVLGSIERAPSGNYGWLARDPHRNIQPHHGDTRRYARTRQHAVIDLLLGLGYSAEQ